MLSCTILIIVIIIIIILLFYNKRSYLYEVFRSKYAPEVYPQPILIFYKRGGLSRLNYRVEIFGDQAYFVYRNEMPIQQDTFDSYSFNRIKNMMIAADKLPQSAYCSNTSVQADLPNHSIIFKINSFNTNRTNIKEINFGTMEKNCTPVEVYTGLRILNRLTEP